MYNKVKFFCAFIRLIIFFVVLKLEMIVNKLTKGDDLMKYEKLFSEGKIGNLKLKNRVVMPAMGTSFATSTGEASDEIIRYYEERAKGGSGLIITEITRIDNETGVGTPNQLAVTDSYQIPRLQKLTRTIHKYDSKIF